MTARQGHGERGQAMIEFALVSTSLLLFFVGTLDLGRVVYYYNVMANSARDGARAATLVTGAAWNIDGNVPGTYTSTVSYIGTDTIVGASAKRGFGMQPADIQVTISTPMGNAAGMALPVTVATQYVYAPVAGTFLGVGAITLRAQSTMRLQ